jgi:mRNA-degrading endonuclease RelE of RelBE toxin-antitoxin system
VKYQIKFKRRAVKDLKALSPDFRKRILLKIEAMQDDLQGDIKKLTKEPCKNNLNTFYFKASFISYFR